MTLAEKINNDIKEAMKKGEKDRLMALRDIKSKLLLEMTKEGGDGTIDEARSASILNKLYKQRVEAAEIYQTQGRSDLVQEEMLQATVIKAYLPQQLEGEALDRALKEIIARTGASGPADLGKVMGSATKELAGKADGRAISESVKRLLSGK